VDRLAGGPLLCQQGPRKSPPNTASPHAVLNKHSRMPRLIYLSGAPKVSTAVGAEAGGARAHVLGIIRAFEKLNWDVQSFIAGDKLPRFITRRGAETLLSGRIHRALVADILRIGLNASNARAVGTLVEGADLAYERFGAFQSLGRRFKRSNVPWILETQGVDFHNSFKTNRTTALQDWARRREIQTYRSCDGIVCSTEDVCREIVDVAGVGPRKILVLPNAVDTDYYCPSKFTPHRASTVFTVGFVGRLYPWQGLRLLFEALRAIKSEGKSEIRLVIIGDGIQRKVLVQRVRELGLQSDVTFMGQVPGDRAAELLMGCDLSYVGHRRSERGDLPFSPIKLFESLSLGVPVVVPSEPGFTDVIKPGRNGFVFSPGDTRSLAQVLVAASRMTGKLEAMGRAGREDVIGSHSWTRRVSVLLDWLADDRRLLRL
jgi:glycosyltransferase involved in cell wall biosynthesis